MWFENTLTTCKSLQWIEKPKGYSKNQSRNPKYAALFGNYITYIYNLFFFLDRIYLYLFSCLFILFVFLKNTTVTEGTRGIGDG